MGLSFTKEEKDFLLAYVRNTIAGSFGQTQELKVIDSDKFEHELAAFVTLHIKGELRGCIGYIESHEPLLEALSHLAISAAFHDSRFQPLSQEELAQVDIEISILTPLVLVEDIAEIIVGKDGLMLRRGVKSGVFLPQVPVEQGWNKSQYLEALCQKGNVPAGSWKDSDLYKFSAEIFKETN